MLLVRLFGEAIEKKGVNLRIFTASEGAAKRQV